MSQNFLNFQLAQGIYSDQIIGYTPYTAIDPPLKPWIQGNGQVL